MVLRLGNLRRKNISLSSISYVYGTPPKLVDPCSVKKFQNSLCMMLFSVSRIVAPTARCELMIESPYV